MHYLIALLMVYPIAKYIAPLIYHPWLRKIVGLENIPKDTAFIIAANHSSYYDTLLPYTILTVRLNKQIHSLSNNRYWKISAAGAILDWGQCIPVYVGKDYDAKKNMQALKKAGDFLKKGHIIQIFPEGTRSLDGKLKKGHEGIAKLALKAKVPVVPFGIIGSNKVLPKGKFFPRFTRCDVKIGKPIYLNQYYKKRITKKILKQATDNIMKELAKLIGQKYEP